MATDIKQSARKFREFWTLAKDSEVGGYQKFWLSLLGDVLRMEDVMSRISFQSPVQLKDTTKFLDAWIPETRVLIEHKARNVKLDAPQAGHGGKTPFEQALEYNIARPFSEKARWIVTCNFAEIWVYDMDHPHADPQKILLANLPKEISRLGFLVDTSVRTVREKEMDISIKAGRIVGELYKELLKRYGNISRGDAEARRIGEDVELCDSASPREEYLAALNRLCVRLVFCFYAEDAEIFPKDCFWKLLNETPAKFLRDRLIRLFRTLDTPEAERDPYLEPELAAFPYTNGGLFRGVSDAEIPPLDDEIRELLIKSSDFDWRDISPTIFGALFESTLNPETRRAGGMVYTSVENIHKVIDPLFMNDLTAELESIKSERAIAVRRAKAMAFQEKLGSLTFLDPACGSGNFLTETFLSLRKLENEAIQVGERLKPGEVLLNLDGIVKVSIKQFHGIEINDFAVSVAKTALWISEAKMLNETANILHAPPKYLPLHDYDGIVEGNALRLDWPQADYIMGNPPFSGARWMGKEQKDDMLSVFGKDWQNVGDLDYVTAWYKKAVDFVSATKDTENTKVAFVSTNSICQGGAVINLWKPLFEKGLEIDFAHRTFRWDNESFEKAHVHCVIVGFHVWKENGRVERVDRVDSVANGSTRSTCSTRLKTIFDNGKAIPAAHINGYLMDAQDVWIESRTKPLCDVPEIGIGNKPIDGGNYLFTKEEKDEFLKKEPKAEPYFHLWYGADEFLNGSPRYCLWLGDCALADLFNLPECLKRVESVRAYRLASKSPGTRKIADKPTRFHVENFPKDHYIVIPEVSSERRRYVPMGYLSSEEICSNKLRLMPDASLYHFGVLNSIVHNAWVRAVCGRLETRYDYSINIVYNNFPWPDLRVSAPLREEISHTAQAILDARAKYPDMTLAQMYGDKMYLFPELVAAHTANDRAVLAAYGLKPDTPEAEIVAHLFKLYAEMTKEV
ncbi:MAG: N-6 DNA methylase [Kiritimatiellae bacterium]|nr:N-6 DNA methylase [Kiritimatiellia bacterium]